ncbi:hypothetical protein CCHL11_09061 [Colletotrichum chlorophyti]|uniref:Uncharacterized protein n=1 Tax=Colletotrichum chlorophyti TaxID=708187 RepID=A0A1Q8RB28_9PEZI|nr:hypothetical protein CCHL11_09061 [Colletotrichum chlorophyti]
MSPNPLCLVWREQIIGNACIDIYTSRHPNKTYTVYAVKVHRGKRQELHSATGRDIEDAFENLHTKSAQEVYQFIDANGFGFPRGVKSDDDDDDDSETSGSEASTLDASDVLSVSAVSSDSEVDEVVCVKGKKTKPSHRKSKRKSSKHSKRNSASSDEDSASDAETTPRRRHPVPAPRPPYIPVPAIAVSQPPPPPPGWRGPPARVFPRGAGGPPPPLPAFPPGMRPQQVLPPGSIVPAVPSAPSKPVRLVIKWNGHGEKKVIESCQPSHRALQRTALAHVRSHWQSFENVVPQEMTPGRLWGLGAKVKRAALGKDMYAISAAAGDDLGMYFKAEDIPKFEIEVDHDNSIIPPPPPPQPLVHHHQ